jgi:hypothetical protein
VLRALASGESFPIIDVPLRGPVAADLGEHFDAARAWADAVRRASRHGRAFTVVGGRIGGRLAGTTKVPVRAVIDSYDQAWHLLGAARDAATFLEIVRTTESVPRARDWVLSSPLAAIDLAPQWSAILAAREWLDAHRDSGLFLRHVSAPGVDTKFIEQHRGVLAALLGAPAGKGVFERALGLATKPSTVRVRFDARVMGAPSGVTEAVLRTDELSQLDVRARRALIVENEISYLSVPIPPGGVVLWGKGYDAHEPASLEWLSDIDIDYWGDIDTHGFSILNRVRARLPHARSILMDRETLLAHEPRWGCENSPTNIALPGLHPAESALYSDLVTDRYGPAIRLEQERVDWEWAAQRLI